MTGPSIELVQATPPPGPIPDQRPGRLLVFLSTFVLAATLGLAANYLRSPVFETSATVLTVKPKGVDETSADADLEHVAIQRRLLLGDEVLAAVADRLQSADHTGESPMDMGRLREMLTVRSVSDTNLVELSAEGGTPELLRDAVNQWADA
ncbi:hypothetical protein ABC977_03565 [Thioalkalicoccus limnaeus]|uniref:Polysaccharide chain length determinant N-terminal domain-containing protein n=1 Tax=Thioalkalicoccus limnaeus TaxID=120681 RepID=A0ABV4BB61_9GAMM